MREGSRAAPAGAGLEPAVTAEAADATEEEEEDEDVKLLELESYPEEEDCARFERFFCFRSCCPFADLPDAESPPVPESGLPDTLPWGEMVLGETGLE